MRTIFFIVISICIFSGCDHKTQYNNNNSIYLNDTTRFTVHQSRFNNTEGFALTLDSVASDSRCPLSVDCIWEGNAALKFTYSGNALDTTFILNTNGSKQFPDTIISNNLIFILTSVEPYPEFPESIRMEDYTCSVVVKKEN
jgi:hypothetical protein